MVWNNPICRNCSQPILSPSQAVASITPIFKFKIAPYQHVSCYLNETQPYARDLAQQGAAGAAALSAMRSSPSSAIGVGAALREAGDISELESTDPRAQPRVMAYSDKGYSGVLMVSLVLGALTVAGWLNWTRLQLAWWGWLAFGLLSLIALALILQAILYPYYRWHLSQAIKEEKLAQK